jgi:hypothetical protein
VLGQSTETVLLFIYDAASQPKAVLELTGAELSPANATGMVLAASTPLHGEEQVGLSLYVLLETDVTHFLRVCEFDFATGFYRRAYSWSYGDVGGAVDLEAADGHLYVAFTKCVVDIDLADTTRRQTLLVEPHTVLNENNTCFSGIYGIAIHGDMLLVLHGYTFMRSRADPPTRVYVYERSTSKFIRSFGAVGKAPGELGRHGRIRCISGRLVIFDYVRLSGPGQLYVGEDRLQVLTLMGEPRCLLTSNSSLLPAQRLHATKRFPLGSSQRLCAGRGSSSDRLFVWNRNHTCTHWSNRRPEVGRDHVWSLCIGDW